MTDIYVKVEQLLTEEERALFLARVTKSNPQLSGAHVADILAMMDDSDFHLELVEPAFDALKDQVKEPDLIGPCAIAAFYVQRPSVRFVAELIARA